MIHMVLVLLWTQTGSPWFKVDTGEQGSERVRVCSCWAGLGSEAWCQAGLACAKALLSSGLV